MVAATADSKALTTARACAAAPCARPAAVLSQPTYGVAAAAIAWDAAPCHAWPAKPEVTAENEDAADPNSDANPSQAAAAASIGSEPTPEKIRKELISGGNTA